MSQKLFLRIHFSLCDGAWMVHTRDTGTLVQQITPITVEQARFLSDLGVPDETPDAIERCIPINMVLYT